MSEIQGSMSTPMHIVKPKGPTIVDLDSLGASPSLISDANDQVNKSSKLNFSFSGADSRYLDEGTDDEKLKNPISSGVISTLDKLRDFKVNNNLNLSRNDKHPFNTLDVSEFGVGKRTLSDDISMFLSHLGIQDKLIRTEMQGWFMNNKVLGIMGVDQDLLNQLFSEADVRCDVAQVDVENKPLYALKFNEGDELEWFREKYSESTVDNHPIKIVYFHRSGVNRPKMSKSLVKEITNEFNKMSINPTLIGFGVDTSVNKLSANKPALNGNINSTGVRFRPVSNKEDINDVSRELMQQWVKLRTLIMTGSISDQQDKFKFVFNLQEEINKLAKDVRMEPFCPNCNTSLVG